MADLDYTDFDSSQADWLQGKKKKKPATAGAQADAIEGTVLGAEARTSAAKPRTREDLAKQQERAAGQAVLDKDKFTMKTPQTTAGSVVANYTGFGLGGAAKVQELAKQGMTVEQIVKKLGLKPKQ